ncbi:MAG: secretin N-terminal domain-containing protein, partial [Verrucomicrobiota bacterium]
MSLYSTLRTAKHPSRNHFLLALGALIFSSSMLLAQQEKEVPSTAALMPAETPASSSAAEPASSLLNVSSHALLPTNLNSNTDSNTITASRPTSTPFSSLPPSPTSSIDSNALSKSIPLIPGTSSKQPKSNPAKLRSLPLTDPTSISSTMPRSKLPAKLGEAVAAQPSSTDTNSSDNSAAIAAISNNPNEKISIQFPHTSILEALSLYEKLTGKRIIRDSNLAGPDLSLMIADPVSKKDAVALLESTMLVNGYAVVPVDEKTIKIIGPSRPPRMEGLPLYQNAAELPSDGERLVSFYQPLHFLSPNEAINILQGVIQVNPYGSLVAVPNTSAIVITDKTPIIQKSLALLQIIDREPSQIITEFISLQRADAEKTVDTLNQIFGKEGSSSTSQTPKSPTSPYQQPPPTPVASSPSGDDDTRIFSGKVQFIPDKRTNRILLVTKAENYRYIRELISKLDQAVQYEEPLVRPLKYVAETDVFPVLVDLLKNKDDDSQNNAAKPQASPQNPFSNNNPSNNSSASNPSNPAGGSSSTTSGSSTGGDLLSSAPQLQPPQSAIIGSSSLIGDPTANSIIVYGPPESKIKARQIIDLLDRRPQQVYLAAVIGEMRLGEGMDYGTSYLFHYQGFNALMSGFTSAPSVLPAATSLAAGAASGAGGLTVFGTLGSLDLYANFLESTGRFRTISRPVVYTSNNRKATILSGQKIPYLSSTLSSVVAGANTAATNNTANSLTSNITYQDVLLKLEVIPLINSDNEVNLIIGQQNQTVDLVATAANAKNNIQAPTVNTQQLTTSVRIPSGSTIVLGGLIEDEKDNSENGIPYINKIPIIGPLFGSHTIKNKKRHELIVMISPTVITSN